MRARERETARCSLERQSARIRERLDLPNDVELLALRWKGWQNLPGSDREKAWVSAALRTMAREQNSRMALLAPPPQERRDEERRARQLNGHPHGAALRVVEELVGALWDLVPFAVDADARRDIVRALWPQTPFQHKTWSDILNLADELASSAPPVPVESSHLPQWAAEHLDEHSDDAALEAFAEAVAKQRDAEVAEISPHAFANRRLARFYDLFGAKGLKLLATASRPAVALALCTDYLRLDPDSAESQWRTFRALLARVEELVTLLEESGDLVPEDFAGGPFAADVSDLKGHVLGAEALERFSLSHLVRWEERLADAGPPETEASIGMLRRIWDEEFGGIPLLCALVNDHIYPERYGCVVDGRLWRLPPKPRLGHVFVTEDEDQLSEEHAVEVFCFGCDMLAGSPADLRVWLALWLGGLRPRESHVEACDLVPYGSGYLQMVPRRYGKGGWREAYLPRSGFVALGLGPEHFFEEGTRPEKPTASAEQLCTAVRDAWERRRAEDPDAAWPAVPGRLSYVVRELVADIIRHHQDVPWVLTKAYGHDTETSDAAYTQLTTSEFSTMLTQLYKRLTPLLTPAPTRGPS